MSVTRRALAGSLALSAGAAAFLNARPARSAEPVRFTSDPFKLGVASGDPTADGVVLWTRLAPEPFDPTGGLGSAVVEVKWTLAADPAFKTIVRAGATVAHPDRGHSVHVELTGLETGRPYWYRFEAGGVRSPAGRTRTLPAPALRTDRFKLAWASCQHFEQGWFTPYRDMAAWEPDLVLHLGDYIYESSWGPQVRRHSTLQPSNLEEFRVHHAGYKLDADLQRAHAAAPWALIWDDHEVLNDYAAMTPANPADRERFPALRAAGYQAWFENLPVGRRSMLQRTGEMRIYQQLLIGDLAQILMLDTRQYSDPRACVTPERWRSGVMNCPEMALPERTRLGADQEYWFGQSLDRGLSRWTVIAQPTLFADMKQKDPQGNYGGYQDGWSGFPAARQRMVDRIVRRGKQDVVVLSGDMHGFFAADVRDFSKPEGAVVATEFVGTSITSVSYNYDRWAKWLTEPGNEHIKFMDDRVRGWAGAEITRDRWTVDFRVADSVWTPNPTFSTLRRFGVEHGKAGVQAA